MKRKFKLLKDMPHVMAGATYVYNDTYGAYELEDLDFLTISDYHPSFRSFITKQMATNTEWFEETSTVLVSEKFHTVMVPAKHLSRVNAFLKKL